MLTAVSAFLLVGYSLVYAAVANGGALARNPWLALTYDAYAVGPGGQASTSTTSVWDSVGGWVLNIVEGEIPGLGAVSGWFGG